jgi:hypothetical protein
MERKKNLDLYDKNHFRFESIVLQGCGVLFGMRGWSVVKDWRGIRPCHLQDTALAFVLKA